MDLTHLHLLITHLPVYGSILGAGVLAYGMITKNHSTRMAAYIVLFISAIGGAIAFSTGEAAEETVKNLQGINKNLIEEHEEFAKLTFAALTVLGISSLTGLLLPWKKTKFVQVISIIILLVSLACFGMASRTGYLGGQIRHTEISKTAP